jgi:predicted metal-dependent hydrolase
MWKRIRDYNRADFHPGDHNTEELIASWRAELFGDEGRLKPLLAGAA